MEESSLSSRAGLLVPALPRWLPWGAGGAGVVLTVVVVALKGNESFGARLAVELAGIVTPLLFAAAGIGGLTEAWRRRQWRRRTQFLAVEAAEQVRLALAELATTLMEVLRPALPEYEDRRIEVRLAFHLPFTPTRQRVFRQATALVWPLAGALMDRGLASRLEDWEEDSDDATALELPDDPTALINGLAARAEEAAVDIRAGGESVQDTAGEVAALIDRDGQDLLVHALDLWIATRGLTTEPPVAIAPTSPEEAIELSAWEAGSYIRNIQVVLMQCCTCMQDLAQVDAALRKRSDDRLPAFIQAIQASSGTLEQVTDLALDMRMTSHLRAVEFARMEEQWRARDEEFRRRQEARQARLANIRRAHPATHEPAESDSASDS